MAMNFHKPVVSNDLRDKAPAPKSVEDLIESAPDGRRNKASMRGSKRAICMTIDPDLLDRFDDYAKSVCMKRGDLVALLMSRLVSRSPSREALLSGKF